MSSQHSVPDYVYAEGQRSWALGWLGRVGVHWHFWTTVSPVDDVEAVRLWSVRAGVWRGRVWQGPPQRRFHFPQAQAGPGPAGEAEEDGRWLHGFSFQVKIWTKKSHNTVLIQKINVLTSFSGSPLSLSWSIYFKKKKVQFQRCLSSDVYVNEG
jgi:hypothetical protein